MGAPSLALIPIVKEGLNTVDIVDGADPLQAAFVNPDPQYDVIIAPSNLGVKLAAAGKTTYKMVATVIWGNLYIAADSADALNDPNTKLAVFGEQAVPGLVFKALFPEPACEVTWYSSVSDAQAALLSGKANAALLAEPALTATMAKAKEAGKELVVAADLQEMWGGNGYPMAAMFVNSTDYEEKIDMYADLIIKMSDYCIDGSTVQADLEEIGAEKFGVPSAAVIAKAWDRLNVNIVTSDDCKEAVAEFLKIFGVEDVSAAFFD